MFVDLALPVMDCVIDANFMGRHRLCAKLWHSIILPEPELKYQLEKASDGLKLSRMILNSRSDITVWEWTLMRKSCNVLVGYKGYTWPKYLVEQILPALRSKGPYYSLYLEPAVGIWPQPDCLGSRVSFEQAACVLALPAGWPPCQSGRACTWHEKLSGLGASCWQSALHFRG